MAIQKREVNPATLVLPDLPAVTKILTKCPSLVEFITARRYADGTSRVPGRFWFEPSAGGFCLTIFDLDQALKVQVRGPSIDDTFALGEAVLSAENAPWEPDQYQLDKRAQKSRKK